MSWKFRLLLVLAFGVLLPGSASFANGGQLHVVAIHGILADVARNVAGDHAEVSSLVPVGADQHGFAPTPSDLTTIAEADLVLINGAGWEESLLDAVESAGEGGNIVDASACVEILAFGGDMHADEHGHDDHDDEHDDDHAHEDDDHGHEDDDHAHEDDDHADEDDDHADNDDDDHAHEEDDDHAHEEDDDHAHDDDDDHADEDDDDHGHEEDDDHAHEDDDDHAHDMSGDVDCDDHDAEFAAIVGEEEGDHDHDHAHAETLGRGRDADCSGGHDELDEHGHAHGACDPHLWMDPHNVIYWALMIRDSLSALDHDHEDYYAANAAAYAQELVALETDFILPALAELPEENRVLVTGHDAFGYFATIFGFEIVTTVIPGLTTVIEPSAREVAEVIDVVRDEGVPAIFSDAHLSDALMNVIASETGVDVIGLHSDSLGPADGPAGTYIGYMRYNVSAIVEALKGDWR